jgi:hypothetical protein
MRRSTAQICKRRTWYNICLLAKIAQEREPEVRPRSRGPRKILRSPLSLIVVSLTYIVGLGRRLTVFDNNGSAILHHVGPRARSDGRLRRRHREGVDRAFECWKCCRVDAEGLLLLVLWGRSLRSETIVTGTFCGTWSYQRTALFSPGACDLLYSDSEGDCEAVRCQVEEWGARRRLRS